MKYIITLLVLATLGIGTYTIQQKLGTSGFSKFNLASAISSTSTSTVVTPNCQSPYQVNQLITFASSTEVKLKNLPTELSSTTRVLNQYKNLLAKATSSELTAKKAYDKNIGNKKITKTAWNKIVSAYETAKKDTIKYRTLFSTYQRLEASLKDGSVKTRLTQELDIYTNPTTGLITLMKKKKVCPKYESSGASRSGLCADKIDNNMDGKTDCADSTCTADRQCVGVIHTEGGETTGGTNTNTNTTPTNPNGGTCSAGGYTDEASCVNATTYVSASCSDGISSMQGDCEQNGGSWDQGGEKNAGNVWTPGNDGNGTGVNNPNNEQELCEKVSGGPGIVNCYLPICLTHLKCLNPTNTCDQLVEDLAASKAEIFKVIKKIEEKDKELLYPKDDEDFLIKTQEKADLYVALRKASAQVSSIEANMELQKCENIDPPTSFNFDLL